jgi:hypothetical protein
VKTGNPVRLRPYRIPFIKPFTKLFPNPVKTPILPPETGKCTINKKLCNIIEE